MFLCMSNVLKIESPPVLHPLPPGQHRTVAHRADVGLMFRLTAVSIVVLATLLGPRTVEAQDCKVLLIPCMYEGVPFALTVVDAETDQPVAEVHGLAEWQNVGYHGRNGPLMVQDAVSGADGVLRFPKWGPIRGYVSGLVSGFDPVVSVFKLGYEVVVEYNKLIVDDTEKARRFGQDGRTIRLVPFRAPPRSWLHQLRMVSAPQAAPISDDDLGDSAHPI